MNFFDTQMGKSFFEGQLPQLIAVLKEISAALKAPRPVIHIEQKLPEDYLVQLYYSNFDLSTAPDKATRDTFDTAIVHLQKEIKDTVSSGLWEKIEHTYSLISARGVSEQEQAFAAGFRTATTMLAAGLSVPAASEEGGH